MVESLAYMIGLLFSLAGLAVADCRYRLVLWHNWRAGLQSLLVGVGVFVAWDLAGIGLNIFYSGTSRYMTGWQLLPDLPIEELLFLTLLCYLPLLAFTYVRRHHV